MQRIGEERFCKENSGKTSKGTRRSRREHSGQEEEAKRRWFSQKTIDPVLLKEERNFMTVLRVWGSHITLHIHSEFVIFLFFFLCFSFFGRCTGSQCPSIMNMKNI